MTYQPEIGDAVEFTAQFGHKTLKADGIVRNVYFGGAIKVEHKGMMFLTKDYNLLIRRIS